MHLVFGRLFGRGSVVVEKAGIANVVVVVHFPAVNSMTLGLEAVAAAAPAANRIAQAERILIFFYNNSYRPPRPEGASTIPQDMYDAMCDTCTSTSATLDSVTNHCAASSSLQDSSWAECKTALLPDLPCSMSTAAGRGDTDIQGAVPQASSMSTRMGQMQRISPSLGSQIQVQSSLDTAVHPSVPLICPTRRLLFINKLNVMGSTSIDTGVRWDGGSAFTANFGAE